MKCDGPRASSCSRSSDNHLVTCMRPPLYLHSRSFDKTTCSAEGRSVHDATMSGRAVCWIILASSSSHIIHQQWTAALHNSLVSSTLLSVRTLDTHQQLSTSWISSVLFTKEFFFVFGMCFNSVELTNNTGAHVKLIFLHHCSVIVNINTDHLLLSVNTWWVLTVFLYPRTKEVGYLVIYSVRRMPSGFKHLRTSPSVFMLAWWNFIGMFLHTVCMRFRKWNFEFFIFLCSILAKNVIL